MFSRTAARDRHVMATSRTKHFLRRVLFSLRRSAETFFLLDYLFLRPY